MAQDYGGKVCAKCTSSLPVLPEDVGLPTSPLNYHGPLEVAYNSDHPKEVNMQPIKDQDKFLETLGLDPEEWKVGYELRYRNQTWTFFILLKNQLDPSKNSRIECGNY